MASHVTVNVGERDDVPDNLRDLIENIPLLLPDGAMESAAKVVYLRAMDGCCMTCATPLGELTTMSMSAGGIMAIHCTAKCMVDQQVMGWLEETYDDLKQTVEFRGSVKADQPEEDHGSEEAVEGDDEEEGQQTGDD